MQTYQLLFLVLVPLLLVVQAGGPFIRFLQRKYLGQYIREDGPQSHQSKKGTPTLGGALILGATLAGYIIAPFVLGDGFRTTPGVWIVLAVLLVFGALGFTDDYLKIAKKKNKGLSGYSKLAVQAVVGLAVGYFTYQHNGGVVDVFGWQVSLGLLYPIFAMLVITATSNALNLTDGLDGLAGGTAVLSFATLGLLISGGFTTATPAMNMLSLGAVAFVLAGACAGFLYHNRFPARIFMGDTGSLALGGALGALCVLGGTEFLLLLIGGIYVLEALSVILQVLSFKITGKRIFRMSPLHHHFELGGWHETKVVFVFVTFQFFLCVLAVFLYNKG